MTESSAPKLRLRRLNIIRFGGLQADLKLDPDRLTLIAGPNEAGKSTLLSALIAGLYGVETRKKVSDSHPYVRDVRPWSGDGFAVELEIERDGRLFHVRRDFAEGTFSLLDGRGTDCSSEVQRSRNRDRLGEWLTGGLSLEGFVRSFILRQEQAAMVNHPGDLVQRLQAVVTAAPNDATARQAIERLERAGNKVLLEGPSRGLAKDAIQVETALRRLEEEIARLHGELEEQGRIRAEAAGIAADIDRREEEIAGLKSRILSLEKSLLLGEEEQVGRRLRGLEEAKRRRSELESEKAKLDRYAVFPLDGVGRFRENVQRWRTLSEDLERRRSDVSEAQKAHQAELERAKEFRGLEHLSEEDGEVSGLLEKLDRWAELQAEVEAAEKAVEEEGRALIRKGHTPEAAESLRAAVTSWPDESLETFKELEEKKREAQRRLEESRRAYEDEVRRGGAGMLSPRVLLPGAIAFLAGAGVVLGLLLEFPALWIASLAVGAPLAVVLGLVLRARFKRAVGRFLADLEAARSALGGTDERLAELARKLGAESPDKVRETLEEWSRVSIPASRYFDAIANRDQAAERFRQERQELRLSLSTAKLLEGGEALTVEVAKELRARLKAFQAHKSNEAVRRAELDRLRTLAEESRKRMQEPHGEIEALCEAAGVPFGEDVEAAVQQFEEMAGKAGRLKKIAEELEALARRLEAEPDDEEGLRRRLERIRSELKGLAEIEAEQGALEDLRVRREAAAEELKKAEEEVQRLRLTYNSRTADLPARIRDTGERIEALQRQQRSLSFQKDALDLAIRVIREVESEVYGGAAEQLNQRLEPILASLSPRWAEARFDENLQLHARDALTGKRLETGELERVLSSGARDSLFLAARLALSDFLAGGLVEAPYLLDEPFAHLDDDRFERGMSLLTGLADRGRQVIVLTCHLQRHRTWIDSLPAKRRAKVEWIDIEAGT